MVNYKIILLTFFLISIYSCDYSLPEEAFKLNEFEKKFADMYKVGDTLRFANGSEIEEFLITKKTDYISNSKNMLFKPQPERYIDFEYGYIVCKESLEDKNNCYVTKPETLMSLSISPGDSTREFGFYFKDFYCIKGKMGEAINSKGLQSVIKLEYNHPDRYSLSDIKYLFYSEDKGLVAYEKDDGRIFYNVENFSKD